MGILSSISKLEDIPEDSSTIQSEPADIWKAPAIHPKIEEFSEPLTLQDDGSKLWRCEFCDEVNIVDLDIEEMPVADTVDYLLEHPPEVDEDGDTSNVIFCIDISGSMCVTTEVNDKLQLKGSKKREERNRAIGLGIEDLGDQFLPGQARGVSFVSRLQCVQSAVETKIEKIYRESPSKRVGIITFSSEVTLLGDCKQEPHIVAGDKLYSWDQLQEAGASFTIERNISESKEDILEKLWDIEESGPTALGPALQLSIAIAGSKPGSSVILCTDGLANVGLGSLDGTNSEVTPYYVELAEQAKLKGVSVSVISLIGSECCLEKLSIVTEQSAGTVQRVDPIELTGKMGGLIDVPVLGYTTMAMIILHRGLQFRGEMDDEKENRNWIVRDMGNVNSDTELTVSYGFRPKEQYDLTNINSVPFQIQLMYSKPNGTRVLRISTVMLNLTDNRQQAEKLADVTVIGTHAALRAAKLAKEGDYQSAQLEARSAQRFMVRNSVAPEKVANWSANVEEFDNVVRNEQLFSILDEDDDAMEIDNESSINRKSKPKRKVRSDQTVEALSKGKAQNAKSLFM